MLNCNCHNNTWNHLIVCKKKRAQAHLRISTKCVYKSYIFNAIKQGGACGVMVIIVGNGHDHMSSNPGRDWLHFT